MIIATHFYKVFLIRISKHFTQYKSPSSFWFLNEWCKPWSYEFAYNIRSHLVNHKSDFKGQIPKAVNRLVGGEEWVTNSKSFTCTSSLKPHNNLVARVLLLFPFYEWGSWGRERLRNIPNITEQSQDWNAVTLTLETKLLTIYYAISCIIHIFHIGQMRHRECTWFFFLFFVLQCLLPFSWQQGAMARMLIRSQEIWV